MQREKKSEVVTVDSDFERPAQQTAAQESETTDDEESDSGEFDEETFNRKLAEKQKSDVEEAIRLIEDDEHKDDENFVDPRLTSSYTKALMSNLSKPIEPLVEKVDHPFSELADEIRILDLPQRAQNLSAFVKQEQAGHYAIPCGSQYDLAKLLNITQESPAITVQLIAHALSHDKYKKSGGRANINVFINQVLKDEKERMRVDEFFKKPIQIIENAIQQSASLAGEIFSNRISTLNSNQNTNLAVIEQSGKFAARLLSGNDWRLISSDGQLFWHPSDDFSGNNMVKLLNCHRDKKEIVDNIFAKPQRNIVQSWFLGKDDFINRFNEDDIKQLIDQVIKIDNKKLDDEIAKLMKSTDVRKDVTEIFKRTSYLAKRLLEHAKFQGYATTVIQQKWREFVKRKIDNVQNIEDAVKIATIMLNRGFAESTGYTPVELQQQYSLLVSKMTLVDVAKLVTSTGHFYAEFIKKLEQTPPEQRREFKAKYIALVPIHNFTQQQVVKVKELLEIQAHKPKRAIQQLADLILHTADKNLDKYEVQENEVVALLTQTNKAQRNQLLTVKAFINHLRRLIPQNDMIARIVIESIEFSLKDKILCIGGESLNKGCVKMLLGKMPIFVKFVKDSPEAEKNYEILQEFQKIRGDINNPKDAGSAVLADKQKAEVKLTRNRSHSFIGFVSDADRNSVIELGRGTRASIEAARRTETAVEDFGNMDDERPIGAGSPPVVASH